VSKLGDNVGGHIKSAAWLMGNARIERAVGLCSGIPRCCVEFFLRVWRFLYLEQDTDSKFMAAYRKWSNADYIRCPMCISMRRKVKVKICTPECGCPKGNLLKRERARKRKVTSE